MLFCLKLARWESTEPSCLNGEMHTLQHGIEKFNAPARFAIHRPQPSQGAKKMPKIVMQPPEYSANNLDGDEDFKTVMKETLGLIDLRKVIYSFNHVEACQLSRT